MIPYQMFWTGVVLGALSQALSIVVSIHILRLIQRKQP